MFCCPEKTIFFLSHLLFQEDLFLETRLDFFNDSSILIKSFKIWRACDVSRSRFILKALSCLRTMACVSVSLRPSAGPPAPDSLPPDHPKFRPFFPLPPIFALFVSFSGGLKVLVLKNHQIFDEKMSIKKENCGGRGKQARIFLALTKCCCG